MILQYTSLIMQPGPTTPMPEERCMQVAFTAKYNSGCISRQVGAVLANKAYSIKAVGWNNTPEGQVPCLLRNVEDLVNGFDDGASRDFKRTNKEFRGVLTKQYMVP
ncbi:MAG: hypothetical protein IPL52_06400 [Flavobacteriales bacterium]|nr:hypothetical protein [Flavobacteriales bacterium]